MDLEAGRSGSLQRLPSRALKPTGLRARLTTGHVLLASAVCIIMGMVYQSSWQLRFARTSAGASKPTDTLVVYVYSNTDPEYEGNLIYFLEKGVAANDGCDYVIIIQEGPGVEETHNLPDTPSNVRFVRHVNECFDWGTFGWALEQGIVDPSKYKYYVLLNSSVRGPFLPSYWPHDLHWTHALTSRITDEVKMVGATISCEGSWKGGVLTGEKRQNPHVQSYVVAVDQTALELVREDPTVLRCYNRYHDAVWYGEMGSSAAVLRAGFNIDALMLRYQGVDWRQTENWGCNAALNPYAEHMYDGIDLSPFEIMFVKLKEFLLEANWTTAAQGKKYSQWSTQRGDIRNNEYTAKKDHLRLIKILGMRHRGPACFDFELYRKRNPDLPKWGDQDLWEHFVKHGQHEGRVFRFRCPPPSPPATQVLEGDSIGVEQTSSIPGGLSGAAPGTIEGAAAATAIGAGDAAASSQADGSLQVQHGSGGQQQQVEESIADQPALNLVDSSTEKASALGDDPSSYGAAREAGVTALAEQQQQHEQQVQQRKQLLHAVQARVTEAGLQP